MNRKESKYWDTMNSNGNLTQDQVATKFGCEFPRKTNYLEMETNTNSNWNSGNLNQDFAYSKSGNNFLNYIGLSSGKPSRISGYPNGSFGASVENGMVGVGAAGNPATDINQGPYSFSDRNYSTSVSAPEYTQYNYIPCYPYYPLYQSMNPSTSTHFKHATFSLTSCPVQKVSNIIIIFKRTDYRTDS